jgi:5-methylcytosine-specific restriction endonuclease McrA
MELRYSFDPERFYLGTLCVHGHRWPGTDKSLRRAGTPSNNCIGCAGRKQSSWLISFIDAEAMGMPAGWRFGKLCKAGHRWKGHEMSLKNRNGKCVECVKLRDGDADRKAQKKAWYENNKEEERRKARERMAARLQDPEQRKIQNERTKACQSRRRSTVGRESRLKDVQGLMMPPGRALTKPEAGVVRQLVAQGHPVDWAVLEPLVAATLQLREALKGAGKSPTVAQLVESERRRYLREHPEVKRQAINAKRKESHRLRYLADETYRLYHRQKSKRRKAQMRDSVAIQVQGREIRARFAEFGHRCAYCGADGDLHIEHVVPISRGGGHAIGNIVAACESCNYSKRDHDPESWYRKQPQFSELRWRKICRVLGWQRSSVGQLALL